MSIKQAAETISLGTLQSLGNYREVEVFALGGESLIATRNPTEIKLFKPMGSQTLSPATITDSEIINAVQRAWPGVEIQTTEKPTESDIYGNLREGSLPPETLRIILNNTTETWVHVDRESGQIVSVMDRSRRQYRWLFNGLHSLDFPGLVNQRPAWDVLILFLLGLGFIFSVTSVTIGIKRLLKH